MSATLYELTETFKEIQAMAQDDNADEQAFLDTLDSINWQEDFEEKCDNYVMVIRNTEVAIGADDGQIAAIEKVLEEVKKSKQAKENKIKRMKESLCKAMIAVDRTKFKSSRFSYWTQKTSEVVITDEANIPFEFMTVPKPTISKTKIKDALKNGEQLSFAHIEEHETARFK